MILKFFWMYIGGFFACSIALMFMVKSYASSFGSNAKRPLILGGVSTAGISGGAYLSTFITEHLFTVFWIFAALYLFFGIIHVAFFHKKYFYSNANNAKKVRMGEIMFAISLILLSVVIFSSLAYFLKGDRDFLFYPMLLSMLTFFLPILVLYTFEAAYKIPLPQFKTWEYPINAPIDLPDERPGEKLLVIAFEIAKSSHDNIKTNFRAKGPDHMVLGELYYHFINDYNELHSETQIEFAENELSPQEWWFRAKPKWYQRNRILDPDLTIRENHIKENTIIICERLARNEEN